MSSIHPSHEVERLRAFLSTFQVSEDPATARDELSRVIGLVGDLADATLAHTGIASKDIEASGALRDAFSDYIASPLNELADQVAEEAEFERYPQLANVLAAIPRAA